MLQDWPFPRADALPPYGFVLTDAAKARAEARGAKLIDLGLGNPDRPTPAEIIEELQRAAEIGQNHRYHPGPGLLELREAAARWYARRYGVGFHPDGEVVVTMGAKEGMSHLCMAILDAGDVALVPDPGYPIHAAAPRIAGARVVSYRARADVPVAAAISESIAQVVHEGSRPKLVIVNYPQNPTGRIVSREEMGQLVSVVRDAGALLLSDLAYADLDFCSRYAPSVFDAGVDPDVVKEFAVETFSMSKSYNMAGSRIAFMVGNRRLLKALSHLKTYLDYGTFAPLQLAAAWALDHGDRFVTEIRDLYHGRATALAEGLRSAGFPDVREPSGTMFVWAKIPERWAAQGSLATAIQLIDQVAVATAPGVGFGPEGEGYLRFALIHDPPLIAEACGRLGEILNRTSG